MTAPIPVLDIQHLGVRFSASGGMEAVRDLSLRLHPGETVGLVGESGSGKSVTALAVMGLLPSTTHVRGQIWLQQDQQLGPSTIDLLALPLDKRRIHRGKTLAMIFQEPLTSLNPVYTCGEQVIESLRLHHGCDRQTARQRAIALFDEVQLPAAAQMMHRYPHELSGGQQQRVMIAIALSGNPAVLIADEPTTALDVTVQATILELLRQIQATRRMAMLFITHDMAVVANLSDRVAVMYQGQLVETAPVYTLFATPQHPYTQRLLHGRPRPDISLQRLPTPADDLQQASVQFASHVVAGQARSEQRVAPNAPLLCVQKLSKDFPIRRQWFGHAQTLRIVDDVSFEVYPGETLGLVGESGCGKSTLSRCLLRLVEPSAGRILFEGQSVLDAAPARLRALRRRMQIVFQNPYGSLNARQRIGSALMEPMVIHHIGQSEAERRDRAIALLERVGLDVSAFDRMPHEFSGGQRQRICIARALACEPTFLICDEAVSALDMSIQAQVLNLLKELQAEFGLTYIFISHDLGVVKFMSDRLMVMYNGRIIETGPTEAVYTNPQQDYTRRLIEAVPTIQLEEIQTRQAARQRGFAS